MIHLPSDRPKKGRSSHHRQAGEHHRSLFHDRVHKCEEGRICVRMNAAEQHRIDWCAIKAFSFIVIPRFQNNLSAAECNMIRLLFKGTLDHFHQISKVTLGLWYLFKTLQLCLTIQGSYGTHRMTLLGRNLGLPLAMAACLSPVATCQDIRPVPTRNKPPFQIF